MIMSGGVIGTLGINAGSPHQEAAWSFIRQFMLPDAEMPIRNGFPLRIDLYDALIAEAMIPAIKQEGDHNLLYDGFEVGAEVPRHWIDVGDGQMIELFAITADEAAGLRELIESASLSSSHFDDTVTNIISEELPRFFAGDRTAADSARIMQNRIQTYLNER
jgi:ABC-type glycerol-3-phosphate transport system substrate-binding protein